MFHAKPEDLDQAGGKGLVVGEASSGWKLLALKCMRLCHAGEIKRWNHHRGPMSHGSKSHRLHGSTGASATPNRTFPGQKMSGHMGDKRVKCRKLKVRPLQSCQTVFRLAFCILLYSLCNAELMPLEISLRQQDDLHHPDRQQKYWTTLPLDVSIVADVLWLQALGS